MTENFDGTEKTFLFASLAPKLKASGLRLAYPFHHCPNPAAGAPSHTSGVQPWKGTTAYLKPAGAGSHNWGSVRLFRTEKGQKNRLFVTFLLK